jgi:hypothetical protein
MNLKGSSAWCVTLKKAASDCLGCSFENQKSVTLEMMMDGRWFSCCTMTCGCGTLSG